MSELKPLHVPPPTTEECGGFKVTKEYVPMDEFERGIKTADMVSVVRCRDCKFFGTVRCGSRWPVALNGYCAWGEKGGL